VVSGSRNDDKRVGLSNKQEAVNNIEIKSTDRPRRKCGLLYAATVKSQQQQTHERQSLFSSLYTVCPCRTIYKCFSFDSVAAKGRVSEVRQTLLSCRNGHH
jgi:hypothetical protein